MTDLSLRDAIYSLRAMRRLKPDPIPEKTLRHLIDAATQAASAENQQSWAFVVVTDPEKRRQLGEIYRDLGHRYIRDAGLESKASDANKRKVYRSALTLVERLGEAPALILVCVRGAPPDDPLQSSTYYGSIYPAIQNLMLTARALGLGSTLTTLQSSATGPTDRFRIVITREPTAATKSSPCRGAGSSAQSAFQSIREDKVTTRSMGSKTEGRS